MIFAQMLEIVVFQGAENFLDFRMELLQKRAGPSFNLRGASTPNGELIFQGA